MMTILRLIGSIDGIGIKITNIINGHKPTNFRIVVSGLEEVQTNTGIVVIAAVSKGVENTNVVAVRNLGTICIENLTVAPSIILIFYHNRAVIVKKSNNICLSIFSVEIRCIVVLYSEYACMVVQEFKSITLLDEVSVGTKKPDR